MSKLTDVSKYHIAFMFLVTANQTVSVFLTTKMKAIRFHETSAAVYQSIWHNIPEDLNVYKSNSLEFLS
jgi:hypothetical protein